MVVIEGITIPIGDIIAINVHIIDIIVIMGQEISIIITKAPIITTKTPPITTIRIADNQSPEFIIVHSIARQWGALYFFLTIIPTRW